MAIKNKPTKLLTISYLSVFFLLSSCGIGSDTEIHNNNWKARLANPVSGDSLISGSTYLSVYSSIYSYTEKTTNELTATISMRNTNLADTVFITKATYYATTGELLRTYFDQPIYILPMETVEIVIHQKDNEGGTGASFVFDWLIEDDVKEPYFEAVMISTSGQQGLSFSTHGIRLDKL